jgi:hypothetical protein
MTVPFRLGFDLDNTLIDYSISVQKFCEQNSLKEFRNMIDLRKFLRETDQSGNKWQLAQEWLYTDGLTYAQTAPGAITLCNYLALNGFQMFIVSHKTIFTPLAFGNKPLREFATNWIKASKLAVYFSENENIYYEASREQKIERIIKLDLAFFVDDLIEVFLEPNYPKMVKSFLISESESNLTWVKNILSLTDLQEIIKLEY